MVYIELSLDQTWENHWTHVGIYFLDWQIIENPVNILHHL